MPRKAKLVTRFSGIIHLMLQLKSFSVRTPPESETGRYPHTIPAFQSFQGLEFTAPVTFFVGENGSGKSTLLEAIACAAASITVGAESVKTDPSLGPIRKYSQLLNLSWQKRTHKGFFLRAEDFFGYAKRLGQIRQGLEDDLKAVDQEYEGRSKTAIGLAKMPLHRELHDLDQKYGGDLDSYSHGESFLTLFQSRFVPNGLYLLDEPEAPLSPLRQLSFISLLKTMVEQDAQFIIATHSPLIMHFPGAEILSFDEGQIRPVSYDDLENVKLVRAFLNDPDAYLRHL
jgi:predicted ATPase